MSAPKVGDRVHVEFDATVGNLHPGTTTYLRPDGSDTYIDVPSAVCTVIAPPVKVGDIVTAENVGQLPLGSIVAASGLTAYERRGKDLWWFGTNGDVRNDGDFSNAVVLRIGGGS